MIGLIQPSSPTEVRNYYTEGKFVNHDKRRQGHILIFK